MKRIRKNIITNAFLENTVAYVFASFVIKGISFVTTPIFTRLMGPADYGVIMNFAMWTQIVAIVICFQVASSVVSANVNIACNRIDSYIYSLTKFCGATLLCFAITVIPLSEVIGKLIKVETKYVSGLLVCGAAFALSDLFSAYCIAKNKVKEKVLFAILSSLLVVITGIILVLTQSDKAYGRINGNILSSALIMSFVFVYFLRFNKGYDKKLEQDLHYALTFSIPLIPHVFANMVNGQIDRLFLINQWGESSVGVYSVAYSVGGIALTVAGASADAWTPWYYEKTREGCRELVSKYYKIYTITIAMCFMGVIFLSPEIMKLMAPVEYSDGMKCIPYIALGIFFLFMYRFPLCYEQLLGNTKYVAPATIMAALINVAINFILIPPYGINGAAIATTTSFFFLWGFHEVISRKVIKKYNIRLIDSLISVSIVIIATLVMTVISPMGYIRYMIVSCFCGIYLLLFRRLVNEIEQ